MLKIYGRPFSPPVNRVRYMANYLGLDYEFVQLNMRAGEHKSPEYLKIHPFGKVPAIQDGDFNLFESNAILRYLASKHHCELYPEDLEKRALVDQWLDFIGMHIQTAGAKVIFNRLFAKNLGMEVDQKSIEEGLKFLSGFLPVIDRNLANHKYLAGDFMSIADISLLAGLDPFEVAQIDLSPYPNIFKWRNELKSKDFYTKCHKNYEDNLTSFAR